MPVGNLKWEIDSATLSALVAAGFDGWKVERDTGPGFTEISYQTTRPPLVANAFAYVYTDKSAPVDGDGEPSADYQAVPHRSSDDATDTPVAATAVRRGYVTPDDIYLEGYTEVAWPRATVWRGIDRATAEIDAICGQWFEPRYGQFTHGGTDHDQLWLHIPVCALHALYQDDTTVELDDLKIYNRHLTRGQLDPDDRMNPKITYALDFPPGYRGRRRRIYADSALFGAGRQNVLLKGVFGYTALEEGDIAAETAEQSQIPISYGQTPPDIVFAALRLAINKMKPLDEQQEATLEQRVTQVRTRDQYVSFSDPTDRDASYGLTGLIDVDNILMRYMAPIRMGAIGR